MARRDTRSTSVLFNIKETVFKERELLDITKPVQVPSIKYVIERFFTIKKELGVRPGCSEFAFKEVASELQELWIFLNLQPKCHSQIVIIVKKLIDTVDKVKRYPVKKQSGATFMKAFKDLSSSLGNGFDIRTTDKTRMGELESKYFVEMSEDSEEMKLYVDDCVPLEDDKLPHKQG